MSKKKDVNRLKKMCLFTKKLSIGGVILSSVEDYTLVDITAKYKWHESFTSTVRIKNITDKVSREINGYSTKGRSTYLSLNYKFNK